MMLYWVRPNKYILYFCASCPVFINEWNPLIFVGILIVYREKKFYHLRHRFCALMDNVRVTPDINCFVFKKCNFTLKSCQLYDKPIMCKWRRIIYCRHFKMRVWDVCWQVDFWYISQRNENWNQWLHFNEKFNS